MPLWRHYESQLLKSYFFLADFYRKKVENIYTLPGVLNVILKQSPNLLPIFKQLSKDLFAEFPHSKVANLSAISCLSLLGNSLELLPVKFIFSNFWFKISVEY